MPGPKQTPLAIRLKRLSEPAANGCRIWIGNCLPRGYPLMGKGGHGNGTMYAHRTAYELKNGPIPKGFDIHHKCENVRCINPKHMELVEHAQHKRKHHNPIACPKGHEFTAENTFYRKDNGIRGCRQCRADYMRTFYQNRKRNPSR
jgi:hypothetical protein